ncbi:MAG TPA: prolyl oligopeptidase family serine peptidase [Myxococcota bacterium]|nr:prolyl oligopeptidase family serine peptidase [Myxococcota bacterium]
MPLVLDPRVRASARPRLAAAAALAALAAAGAGAGAAAPAPATPPLSPILLTGPLTVWEAGGRVIASPDFPVRLPDDAGGRARVWLQADAPARLACGGWASAAFEVTLGGVEIARGVGGGELVRNWLELEVPLAAGRSELALHVAGAAPRFVFECQASGADPGDRLEPFERSRVKLLVPAADPAGVVADACRLSLSRDPAGAHPGHLGLHESVDCAVRTGAEDTILTSSGYVVRRGGKVVASCTDRYGCGADLADIALAAGRYEVELVLTGGPGAGARRRFTADHDPAVQAVVAASVAALGVEPAPYRATDAREKHGEAGVQALAALLEALREWTPLEVAPDARARVLANARLALARLRGGAAALAAERGLVPRGLVSRLDGYLQVYGLYLPHGKLAGRPLVLGLHGAGSTGTEFCRKLLGGAKSAPGLLACPDGYGPSGFLYAGGDDALDVLAAARALGPADPARVYVTGGSHGGVGTYALALAHPELFAAAAVLSGSADVALFPSIAGKPRAAHEDAWLRAHAWRGWAMNARNVAFEVVHGGKDPGLPETHAAVFKEAMDALGLPLGYTVHADLGHDVWTRTYAGGAIWRDFFDAHAKPAAPADVWLTTPGPPVSDAWATIWRLAEALPPLAYGTLRARAADGKVTVTTSGLDAVTLAPPAALPGPLVVDGDTVRREAPFLWRRGGHWIEGPRPGPWREGPLDAVRARPLRVAVDGTSSIGFAMADQERLLAGMKLYYPIYASPDVWPDEHLRATNTVLLYGNPSRNHLLAEVLKGSPVGVDDRGVTVLGTRYEGADVGVRAILPSPWSDTEYAVVVAGPTKAGVRCAVWLPEVLPDWAVCTSKALVRPGGMILGEGRKLLGAGFWGRTFWRHGK